MRAFVTTSDDMARFMLFKDTDSMSGRKLSPPFIYPMMPETRKRATSLIRLTDRPEEFATRPTTCMEVSTVFVVDVPDDLFAQHEVRREGAAGREAHVPYTVMSGYRPRLYDRVLSGLSRRDLAKEAQRLEDEAKALGYYDIEVARGAVPFGADRVTRLGFPMAERAKVLREAIRFFDVVGWRSLEKAAEAG